MLDLSKDINLFQGDWVNVKSELPTDKGSYLTFNGYGQSIQNWNENGWLNMFDAVLITHWMPLPEQPKEEVKWKY